MGGEDGVCGAAGGDDCAGRVEGEWDGVAAVCVLSLWCMGVIGALGDRLLICVWGQDYTVGLAGVGEGAAAVGVFGGGVSVASFPWGM